MQGEAIAREADRRDKGFMDSITRVEMVLTDKTGNEARRTLTIKTLQSQIDGVGDKNMVVFHAPLDLQGTALLTHSGVENEDRQWLYLPTLKRVKRVSSSNRAGSFVASEFSYEDMMHLQVEHYKHRYLDTVRCGDLKCFKLERTPRAEDSGYKRQIAYIDSLHYRVHRIDYFNRQNNHIKTLYATNWRVYKNMFWRAANTSMVNHQTGKTTHLIWGDFSFRNGFASTEFSRTAMAN